MQMEGWWMDRHKDRHDEVISSFSQLGECLKMGIFSTLKNQ